LFLKVKGIIVALRVHFHEKPDTDKAEKGDKKLAQGDKPDRETVLQHPFQIHGKIAEVDYPGSLSRFAHGTSEIG
jgi:hypothetical protein